MSARCDCLIALVGPDVRRLTHGDRKALDCRLPGEIISADLVESFVANSREMSNFDLTDHLFAGRRTRGAQRYLNKILDDGGEPLTLLGLISYERSAAVDGERSDVRRALTGPK